MIILPPQKQIIIPEINDNLSLGKARHKGFYRAELRDEMGNIKYETDWKPNLMTDLGLYYLAWDARPFANGWLGTSNVAPDVSQTTLQGTQIGASIWNSNLSAVNKGAPNYEVEMNLQYISTQGNHIGAIGEFCTSPSNYYSTPTGYVCLRCIFDPVINKGANDHLTIYYKYYWYVDLSDVVGVVDIEGVAYNYRARPWNITWAEQDPGGAFNNTTGFGHYHHRFGDANGAAYGAALSAITGSPTIGTNAWCSSAGNWVESGDATSGYTVGETFVWNIDTGNNVGSAYGIRIFTFNTGWSGYNYAGYQVEIGKVSDGTTHPKVDTHEFSISASITTTRAP